MENERIKTLTLILVEDYKKQHGVTPCFKHLIEDCIYLKGITTADYLFESLRQGWVLNNFEETDFKKVQNELFPFDRNYLYGELEKYVTEQYNAEMNAHYSQSKK